MSKELTTIRDWIRWAASKFNAARIYFGHGTETAWDEAVYLTLHTLQLPNDCLSHVLDAHLTANEKIALDAVFCLRVEKRLPAAYITHEAWFAGLPFYVDERVLIPRSPLAELIERQFSPWIEFDRVHHILDLCTGSACIAVACAHEFPDAKITASDISLQALAVAQINIEKHQLTKQIHLQESDIFNQMREQKFDIIISNPPYVDNQDMVDLPLEYKHEPRLALAAGEDGLIIINKILLNAEQHLTEDGVLIVEVGNSDQALIAHYPQIPFTWLEFFNGDTCAFLLTKAQLQALQI